MASLFVDKVSKRFGDFDALSDVSIRVEEGSFCVLLGPSGCGKSTLLNIIAGLIPQDGGRVLVDGEPVDHLSPRERDMAMVFQSYALYPHMTVAQNLGFGLKMRKIPKPVIQEKIQEAANLLGIQELLNRRPRELSGGQRQRVAMGRALVRRPRLFLFDEPLSNLDARLRANVRMELKRIHRRIKGTVIYVTHDQVEAMTLGDSVAVMNAGKIHQIGPPGLIYERPVDKFVATFIGFPEMNFLKGKIVHRQGIWFFQGNEFTLSLGEVPVNHSAVDSEVGLRPEDIQVLPQRGTPLQIEVELVSNIGSESVVHARLGEETINIIAPKDITLKPGDRGSISVAPERIHLFRNGLRI
ncbi:MAG TPA: ABC transporter ATP-binding protein [Desulfobacteraceae bacterium]|nr:ABC transporter ATP-binding protein [Desulfobacteraceae bacterium]